MVWRIEIDPAAIRELDKLGPEAGRRITTFLFKRLAQRDDPRSIGEALKGSKLGAFWKYRVGDYRIIAHIEDDLIRIIILRIGHRRQIYD